MCPSMDVKKKDKYMDWRIFERDDMLPGKYSKGCNSLTNDSGAANINCEIIK